MIIIGGEDDHVDIMMLMCVYVRTRYAKGTQFCDFTIQHTLVFGTYFSIVRSEICFIDCGSDVFLRQLLYRIICSGHGTSAPSTTTSKLLYMYSFFIFILYYFFVPLLSDRRHHQHILATFENI